MTAVKSRLTEDASTQASALLIVVRGRVVGLP